MVEKQKPDKFYYATRIVTGEQGDAGTLASAYIVLIGDKAKTTIIHIQTLAKHVKESGTYDDFIIECDRDLGDIQLVTVGVGKKCPACLWARWYVGYTLVKNLRDGKETIFPCYHWIGLDQSFTNAASCSELI